jgi:hypothetical protein
MSNTNAPHEPITCAGCGKPLDIGAPLCTHCKSPSCPKCLTGHEDEFGLVDEDESICSSCYDRRFELYEYDKYQMWEMREEE